MKRYMISLMESERGWGQDYWFEYYDSYEEAKRRIDEVNSKNTTIRAPDYYIQAEEKIVVIGESYDNLGSYRYDVL